MAEEKRQIPTYTLGDTIRVELDVSDESGVAQVIALFRMPPNPTINYVYLKAAADGKDKTKVVMEKEVSADVAPGEYSCDWVQLEDGRGNKALITGLTEMRFRVEGIPGDHEGPTLNDWQVIWPGSLRSEEEEAPGRKPPVIQEEPPQDQDPQGSHNS